MFNGVFRTGRTRLGLAAVGIGLGTLLGCGDLLGSGPRPGPEKPAVQEAGIHPVLVLAGQRDGEATVELHLQRVQVAERIGSYQGWLRYDAGRYTLQAASIPRGITGAANEPQAGTIRFAGIAVEGIDGGAVLSLRFSTRGPVTAEGFELSLEELVASEGFADLKPRVRQLSAQPRLSRSAP